MFQNHSLFRWCKYFQNMYLLYEKPIEDFSVEKSRKVIRTFLQSHQFFCMILESKLIK